MHIGISSYTYTWAVGVPGYPSIESPLTAVDLIRRAYELGVEVVQICDNIPLHHLSQSQLSEIKQEADRLGISLEIGTRGVGAEHLMKYLDIASCLNSELVRVILEKNGGSIAIEEAADQIKKVLPQFEDKGIYIAIENHERHKASELVHLIKKLDSPFVGICLDTVNSFGALECPREVIETLAPYTINLHFKDFIIRRLDHKMGFEILGSPAGKGMLDIQFIMDTLGQFEQRLSPNLILELWTPYEKSIEATVKKEERWAEISIKYLKEWFK